MKFLIFTACSVGIGILVWILCVPFMLAYDPFDDGSFALGVVTGSLIHRGTIRAHKAIYGE